MDVGRFEPLRRKYIFDESSRVMFDFAPSDKESRSREEVDARYSGIGAEKLSALLNEWRARHAGPVALPTFHVSESDSMAYDFPAISWFMESFLVLSWSWMLFGPVLLVGAVVIIPMMIPAAVFC